MFNCFAVILAGADLCYFNTEMAAENFITMWNATRAPISGMKVEGRYIPGVF